MTLPPTTAAPLLDGLRVLEWADFVAGPFTGRLLADLGAAVTKVELPGGDSARRHGPFFLDRPHRETSAVHLNYNLGKRSVRLDPATRSGRRLLDALLDETDVLVYDLTPAEQQHYRATPAEIMDGRPRLVVGSVTPYGLTGPAADAPSAPLTRVHSAGAASTLVRGLGIQAAQPLATGALVNEADGGTACAIAVIAALIARGERGDGQLVEVSLQEAIATLDRVDLSIAYNDPQQSRRAGSSFGGRLKCADGHCIVITPQPHQWRGLIRAVGDPPWAFDDQGRIKTLAHHSEELHRRLAEWAATRTREEIYRAGQAESAPVGPVFKPSEVMTSQQERERGFFEQIGHAVVGVRTYAALAAIFTGLPPRCRRAAPSLGQDTAAAVAPFLPAGWTPAQARRAGIA